MVKRQKDTKKATGPEMIDVITRSDTGETVEVTDYVLTRCHGRNGRSTGMWWVNRKDPENCFRKLRKDIYMIEKEKTKEQ